MPIYLSTRLLSVLTCVGISHFQSSRISKVATPTSMLTHHLIPLIIFLVYCLLTLPFCSEKCQLPFSAAFPGWIWVCLRGHGKGFHTCKLPLECQQRFPSSTFPRRHFGFRCTLSISLG